MCGLSTRKTLHAVRRPRAATTSRSAVPEPAPVLAVPVDVVDVLVALGRVLGVLERAVGAAVEPLGVLGQPRVVGRALDREVERDRRCRARARSAHSASKSSIVPSSGWTASWPPSRGADRPRASRGRPGRRSSALLRPLRFVRADRVDRRQVEDVEAELGDLREQLLDALRSRPTSAGTSSYQAPKRARSRSTSSAQRRRAAASPWRSAWRSTAASSVGRERGVALRGLGRGVVAQRVERALEQRPVGAALGAAGGVARAAARPRTSSPREVVLAGGDLALQLVAPGREGVAPGLDRPLPAARRRRPRTRPPSGRRRRARRRARIGASRQRAARRGRGSGRPRAGRRGRRGRSSARDVDACRRRSAWRGSARSRRSGCGVLDPDPRRGCSCVGTGIWRRAHPHCAAIRERASMNLALPRSSGVQLHPTSLPGGRLGRRGLRVRRLARRGRPVVVADAAARAARPLRLAVQGGVGVRRLARAARRARRARSTREEVDAFREREALLDRRLGALRRAARRASPTRSASSASGRRCARYAAERGVRLIGDVPIYVAPGQRRPPRAPASCSATAPSPASPPDAFTDTGQLWGNPLYDWPALQRRGYRWWIERLRAHLRALRPRAHRPLPRLRRLLGGAGAAPATRAAGAGGAGPGGALFDAARARARRSCR